MKIQPTRNLPGKLLTSLFLLDIPQDNLLFTSELDSLVPDFDKIAIFCSMSASQFPFLQSRSAAYEESWVGTHLSQPQTRSQMTRIRGRSYHRQSRLLVRQVGTPPRAKSFLRATT